MLVRIKINSEGGKQMKRELLEKYAYLLVKVGLDVQPGQKVIIEAPVETYDFARMVTKAAYQQKAGEVVVHYTDASLSKFNALNMEASEVAAVQEWEKQSLSHYLDEGACSLLFASPNPHLMDDLNGEQAHAIQTHTNDKRNIIRSKIASDGIQWCIAAVPNQPWAEAVMPNVDKAIVLDKFWEQILKLVYVDERHDPVETWYQNRVRKGELQQKLTDLHLDRLHISSSNGTDIEIGLHEDCSFGRRYEKPEGRPDNVCNIPTEEICTTPDKWRTNGKVVSARPLLIGGKIIDHFEVTFKDGRVTDCKAEIGEDLLKATIETDEGAHYLGEVAFVPYHSPISLSGYVYYNTLIDENASCHLALGRGFPHAVGADAVDKKSWEKKHVNDSVIHIDFMIGTADTKIIGYTKDGKEIAIFVDGDFAL